MNDNSSFDQHDQTVEGNQINVKGGKGNVNIYSSAAKHPLPLQKPRRPDNFIGREKEVQRLLEDLRPAHVVTICGPGGIGKTALAVEAIWQIAPGNNPPTNFPDGIVYYSFYDQPQAVRALVAIALSYGEDLRPTPAQAALRALNCRKALLVLDGAEEADDLESVLRIAGSCGVLITTRRHSDAPSDSIDLQPLHLDKAIQLLHAWGREYCAEESSSKRICELIGCLPLAVILAGRYMAQCQQFDREYLAWLEETPLAALDLGKRQDKSILLLMEHSIDQVNMIDKLARSCLGVAGILSMEPFDSELISIALDITPQKVKPSLAVLVDFGLLLRPYPRYQVTHAIVHTYARGRLTQANDVLVNLAEYYIAFAPVQNKLGPSGYANLDAHRAHIIAVQSACLKAKEYGAVRRLTWAIYNYLGMQGHWTERITVVETGLSATRRDGARSDEGSFLNILGITNQFLGDYDQSIEQLEQALTIAREIDDPHIECTALNWRGVVYFLLCNPRKAIELFEQALETSKQIKDYKWEEGNPWGPLGLSYYYLGECQTAIENYKNAMDFAKKNHDRALEYCIHDDLGVAFFNRGETDKATELFKKALKIAHDIRDRRGEGAALGDLGRVCYYTGKPRRGITLCMKQLDLTRQIGDRLGEGAVLSSLGCAYYYLGETEQAIEYYKDALAILQNMGCRWVECSTLDNMGRAYADLGETQKAIEISQQALDIAQEIDYAWGKVNALDNLGRAYVDLGETQKAIEISQQALDIAQEIDYAWGKVNALDNLGRAYNDLSETPIAIEICQQALDIAQKIDYAWGKVNALNNLGQAYNDLGETQKAIEIFQQASDIAKKAQLPTGRGKSYF